MKIKALQEDGSADFSPTLDQMYELRAKVFSQRLGWEVQACDGRERDRFDELKPTYILAVTQEGDVVGCVRLLPALGPTMLTTIFPQLVSAAGFSPHGRMLESSRFCVDTAVAAKGEGGLHHVTRLMFAGIIDWCLRSRHEEIVTVTDVVVERILARAGWHLHRLASPQPVGETLALAGILKVDQATFERVRPQGYLADFAAPLDRSPSTPT